MSDNKITTRHWFEQAEGRLNIHRLSEVPKKYTYSTVCTYTCECSNNVFKANLHQLDALVKTANKKGVANYCPMCPEREAKERLQEAATNHGVTAKALSKSVVEVSCSHGHVALTDRHTFMRAYRCVSCAKPDTPAQQRLRAKYAEEGVQFELEGKSVIATCQNNHVHTVDRSNFAKGWKCPTCKKPPSPAELRTREYLAENGYHMVRYGKYTKVLSPMGEELTLPLSNIWSHLPADKGEEYVIHEYRKDGVVYYHLGSIERFLPVSVWDHIEGATHVEFPAGSTITAARAKMRTMIEDADNTLNVSLRWDGVTRMYGTLEAC
jgi:hypothetical protein